MGYEGSLPRKCPSLVVFVAVGKLKHGYQWRNRPPRVADELLGPASSAIVYRLYYSRYPY